MTEFEFIEPEKQEKQKMAFIFDGEISPTLQKLHDEGYGICAICGRKLLLDVLETMADGKYHSCEACKDWKLRPRRQAIEETM